MDTAGTEAPSLCVVNLFSADVFLLGQNCLDLQGHENPGRSKTLEVKKTTKKTKTENGVTSATIYRSFLRL